MKRNYVIAKPNQHSTSVASIGSNGTQFAPAVVDSLSTPARRRRIIADVARFLLKQYCSKACVNVKRIRLETKSSVIIQCSFRCHLAKTLHRKLVEEKRVLALLTIQCAFRKYMAKCLYKLLLLKRRRVLAIKIAIFCQKYWRGIMARSKYLKLLNSQKQFWARRKRIAATLIQVNTRGLFGRLHASNLRKERVRLRKVKWTAAIKIQSVMRRDIARRKFTIYRQTYFTLKFFHLKWVSFLFIRRKQKFYSTVLIQRYWRGKSARIKLRLLKLENFKNNELERLRLQSLLNASKVVIPEPPALEIRVTIILNLLRHMAALGPAEVIKWCLQNFVLYYHSSVGYSLGPVLNQVVNAVEKVMPSIYDEVQEENPIISVNHINDLGLDSILDDPNISNEKTRVVELEKWDTGNDKTVSDNPIFDHLPQRWNQIVQLDQGASISVEFRQKAIQVHVKLNVDVHQRLAVEGGGVLLPKLSSFTSKNDRSVHLLLVLEAVDVNDSGNTAIITPADGGLPLVDLVSLLPLVIMGSPPKHNSSSDVRFQFKNAIVFVTVQEAIPPPPEVCKENSEIAIIPPILPENVHTVQDIVLERPASRAKIILTLSDEPIIDYDSFASRIQRICKRWLLLRVNACQCIKRILKRISMLYKWRVIVKVMFKIAIDAAVIIQCRIRRYKAKLMAIEKRGHACNTYLEFVDRIVKVDFDNEKEIVHRSDTITTPALHKTSGLVASVLKDCSCSWGQSVFKILQIRESVPGCVNPTESLFLADPSNTYNDGNHGNILNGDRISTKDICNYNSNILNGKEVENFIFPPVFNSISKEFNN